MKRNEDMTSNATIKARKRDELNILVFVKRLMTRNIEYGIQNSLLSKLISKLSITVRYVTINSLGFAVTLRQIFGRIIKF